MVELRIDEAVHEKLPGLCIGISYLKKLTVKESGDDLSRIEKRVINSIKKNYSISELKDHPIISCYRDALWRLDIDPTKNRPVSEALIRRILRTGSFPKMNNAVDAMNLAMAKTFLPMGIYDSDRIVGDLILRFAKKGEEFMSIEGLRERMEGKELVVSDELRIIHVYPYKDCEETKIGLQTENAILLVYGAPKIEIYVIRDALKKACEYLRRFTGCKTKSKIITA